MATSMVCNQYLTTDCTTIKAQVIGWYSTHQQPTRSQRSDLHLALLTLSKFSLETSLVIQDSATPFH